MEDLDPTFYKNLKYLLEINLDENPDIEFYFSVEESEFGVHKVKDLIPDGRNIRVNESNKMDYIQHLCEMKMTRDINA